MKISLLRGRLGKHRFHMMLVHFPSALYPFSFVMDVLYRVTENVSFAFTGFYALAGAVIMSVAAMLYGMIDFLQIDSNSKGWKVAGIHALLNLSWFVVYTILLFYRIKQGEETVANTYLAIMGLTTLGLFFSNYLGGELVVRYGVGVVDNLPEIK